MWYICQKLAAACLIGKVQKCWEKSSKMLTLDLQIGHDKPLEWVPRYVKVYWPFCCGFFFPPLALLAPLPRKGWAFFKSVPLWCQKGHSSFTDILLVPLPQRSWDKLLGAGVFFDRSGKTALSDVTKGLATFSEVTTSPTASKTALLNFGIFHISELFHWGLT